MSEDINKRLLNFEKELKEFHNKDYIKVEEKKVEEEKVLGIKELKEKLDKENKKVEKLDKKNKKNSISIKELILLSLIFGK